MPSINYEQVVRSIVEGSDDAAAAFQTLNEAGLSPSEFYNIANKTLTESGVKYATSSDGKVINIFNNKSTNFSSGNVDQSLINSNAQSGTASAAANVQYAASSTVDQQTGNIQLNQGVTKYNNGTPTSGVPAVLGYVATGAALAAAGVTAGKVLSSGVYAVGSALFPGRDWSTYNPATWSSITADMSDTGIEGLQKKAFNFLFQLDDSNNATQAYMSKDAFEYLMYALAQNEVFSPASDYHYDPPTGGVSNYMFGSYDIPFSNNITLQFSEPSVQKPSDLIGVNVQLVGEGLMTCIARQYNSQNIPDYVSVYAIGPTTSSIVITRYMRNGTTSVSTQQLTNNEVPWDTVPSSGLPSAWRHYTDYSKYVDHNTDQYIISSIGSVYTPNISSANGFGPSMYIVHSQGTPQSAVPGVTDQAGATVPSGLSPSSTQQDVADAIAAQYPDLHNNRIEQTVVQPDGTTKTIVYYPVAMPNDTSDTELTDPVETTIAEPIYVIIPEGVTITLPDGTVVTGDGVTPIALPPGTYVLPSGVKIIGNPTVNTELPDGGSQADPSADLNSTVELLQQLIRYLTSPVPNPVPQPEGETGPADMEPTDPNPDDMGDGTTPVAVIPNGSASALFSVYNPTQAQLNSFGAWLWSGNLFDQILKLFNDPMQAIIGLHKTFIPPSTGSAVNIKVGYLDSGVSSLTVPTQYSTVDCGTVSLPEYFGNVFDYSPYTRVYIFLPFIGFRELDVAQVMRGSINVKYRGDAYSGAALAEVSVNRDGGAGGVLYTFACDMAVRYPLSQGSYAGFITGIANLAAGVAGAMVLQNPIMAAGGLVSAATSARNKVTLSGNFTGNAGAMGGKKPYLVIMRPQTAMPSNYQHFSGAPSSSRILINNASGLIRVRECHVDKVAGATQEEKIMIERCLKEGVIV